MTDLSSLFIVCSHGRRSAHDYGWQRTPGTGKWEWCPGGRPATLEDLGGEKINWCSVHRDRAATASVCVAALALREVDNCDITERILLPLPQMVAGESL